jgi:large subunit ribosomal protein L29
MKGIHAKDLRGNEAEELGRTLAKLQNDLFQHRLKKSTNQLENTMLIRNARRDIAKIHTVLTERQQGAKGAVPAAKSAKSEKEK